ncbi:MAG TPA: hypothetical protein VHK03_10180 [Aestuariivirgaceae bacterium]|jgi:hypothetical protein|nr:hypothetical protein [Aestuariivirgaceae bacterium]
MKNIQLVANPLLRLVAERCIDRRSNSISPVFTLLLSNSSNFIAELPFVYLPDGLMEIHAAGAMTVRQLKGLQTLVQISPVAMTRLAPGEGLVVCNGLFAPGQPNGGRFAYMSGAANMPLQRAVAGLEPAPSPASSVRRGEPAFIK